MGLLSGRGWWSFFETAARYVLPVGHIIGSTPESVKVYSVGRTKPSKKPIRNVVSAEIRRHRLMRNISQEELAAQLQRYGWDVGRTTITKIELGERCVTDFELIAIADVLQVGVQVLVGRHAGRKKIVQMLNDLDR